MRQNLRNATVAATVIGLGLLLASYLLDDGNSELSGTLRDMAELVLTTEGKIEPTLVGVVLPGTPQPTLPVATVAATSTLSTPAAPPQPVPPLPTLPSFPLYQVYFTTPTCPALENRQGGLDELIASQLLQAGTSVDVAAFDLDLDLVVDALIALRARNIPVRIVTDTDNVDLASIRRLRRNGISVVEDKRSGLMHNKFIIIDQRYLWTGSLNLSSNGVYCNNNNFVRFDAPALALNYRAEMDEMYDERAFGPTSPVNTPNEKMVLNGIAVENYFSPEKEMELVNVIARTVVRAEREILFLAFSFTNEEIGEAMLGRADAGVAIRGIFERTGADRGYYPLMQDAGLPNVAVRLDGNSALLHHKVIIVDRQTVIFGSFNFSASANRNNDENILVVHDPLFASEFVREFEARWAEATES